MRDGVGKDGLKLLSDKQNRKRKRKKNKLGGNGIAQAVAEREKNRLLADEIARAVARIAVAQIFVRLGFGRFHGPALDTIVDVGVRYIREIGKAASSYANLANRNECNVFDVIQGLEDLGSVQGFSGASDVSHALSRSGVVKDNMWYFKRSEEIPFAHFIDASPIVKERKLDLSFTQAKEKPPNEHIPSWLPKFPDPQTYADLSSGNEKNSETENKTLGFEEQHRKVERPLLDFKLKLSCNGSEDGAVVEQGNAAKAQRAVESIPFLAPLQFGGNEVYLPVFPAELLDEAVYHQSREDPSFQANEDVISGPCETEDRRKILLNGRRSKVCFKFENGRKSSGKVTSPQNEAMDEISLWFGDDKDGEGEKKRKG